MINKQEHIEQIIREKFNDFAPIPSGKVWAGIEKDLGNNAFSYYRRVILLMTAVACVAFVWFMLQKDATSIQTHQDHTSFSIETTNTAEPTVVELPDPKADDQIGTADEAMVEDDATAAVISQAVDVKETVEKKAVSPNHPASLTTPQKDVQTNVQTKLLALPNVYPPRTHIFSVSTMPARSFSLITDFEQFLKHSKDAAHLNLPPNLPEAATLPGETSNIPLASYLKMGLYYSPEYRLQQMDSVQLSATYTISAEPSFFFKKHWFVRTGLGLSFSKDVGFAQLDRSSYEMLGVYDDVYEVTFDTSGNTPIPIYHTQPTEVWDSVRKNGLVEVTNHYQYIQLPLLLGAHWGWHNFELSVYAGPAFNFLVGQNMDDLSNHEQHATVHLYENKLPGRENTHIQLWAGAGIEYRLGYRFSIAAEPNFRYQLSTVYSDPDMKKANSLFAIRFGLIYQLSNSR